MELRVESIECEFMFEGRLVQNQVFLTSVEKDIGKKLTDAQSAKKKKKNEFSD